MRLSMRCAGFMAAAGMRGWMSTLDYRGAFYDRAVDAVFPSPQMRIYVFWHEYILLPLYLRGNCRLTMLLSQHRDADILASVGSRMGVDCVRGSTYKGGTAALIELARRGRHMHIAITPDGPRGPRRKLAQGPVFLASKLGLPIVPLGFGVDRPWRTPTWDRFAIPRPYSRARSVVGPEVFIPPNLDRDQLEQHRLAVERLLNDLTSESEAWAASNTTRVGAVSGRRQGQMQAPLGSYECQRALGLVRDVPPRAVSSAKAAPPAMTESRAIARSAA